MNKAEKSQIIVPVICFVCVFLSAVLIWSYYSKPADEDGTLSVTIKYPEYETAVITPVSTMECAIDNKFLHELQQISESSDGNTNEHIYNYQYDTLPDKIYIKAPDIYVFEQGRSNSSMTPCSVGSVAYYAHEPLFSITSVTVDKLYTGVFDITISIESFKDIVPVMATLKIGDIVLNEEGSAPEKEMAFENDNYISETFQFRYNRGALNDISDLVNEAAFCTEDVFRRISGAQITAKCNIPSVKVVIEDSGSSSSL